MLQIKGIKFFDKKNSAERGKEIHEQPWKIVLARKIEIYDTLPAFVLKILDFQLLSISLFLTAGLHCPIKTLEQKVKSSSPTDGAYYLTHWPKPFWSPIQIIRYLWISYSRFSASDA